MSQDREIIKMLIAALDTAGNAFLSEKSITRHDDVKEQKAILRKRQEAEQVVKYAADSGREYLKKQATQ
jgi:hypothetical protein